MGNQLGAVREEVDRRKGPLEGGRDAEVVAIWTITD